MGTLETAETVIEGLVASKEDEIGNRFVGTFDLGKMKCVESAFAPVAESHCIDYKVKGTDSTSNGDFPIKGISLVVELTGGVAYKPDRERIRDVGGGLLYENLVKVNVGDFVWALIQKGYKLVWWPGIVYDAANASKEAANRPSREDDILVRCFGTENFIWCSPYDVKPFVGHFDEIPNQSNAKNYLNALGKALTELGHRVQSEFTCSCLSNVKTEKRGHFGDISVARFEPAMFLDYIKELGKSNSMPNIIDYVVKHNCLYAFYRSLGHLQIPLDQLQPANETPLKIKTEEKNGYFGDDTETRERIKSWFFPYPGACGIVESSVDVNGGINFKTNGQSQPVKKPSKKWARKNKAVLPNLCLSEVLSQLQFAAKDCLFECESKNFDSVRQFISGFRKLAFNDSKDKPVISPALGNNLNHGPLLLDFQNAGPYNLEAQSMAYKKTEWPANQSTTFHSGGLPRTQPPICKLEPKRRKHVENVTSMPTWNADFSNLPNVNHMGNITSMHTWNADIRTLPIVNHMGGMYQAPVYNQMGGMYQAPYFTGIYAQPQLGPVPTGLGRVPKKRGRKRKNIDLQSNPGSTIPFQTNPCSTIRFQANPGSTIPLQANPGSTIPLQANPGSIIPLQANPGSTIALQANPGLPIPLQATPGSTIPWQANPGSTIPLQANPGSTVPLQANPGPTIPLQANLGSAIIPYVNEDITSQNKQKKVKNKEVGVPCVNLSYTKVQQDNLEVKGTAFLLKFSSDHPLPSNQDLKLVFSKFGELIESETLVSNENLSGQVVFLDPSSAGGAFWGLQNDKPFGPALVNYKIQHLADSESMASFKTPITSLSRPKPIDSKAAIHSTVIPDLNTNSTELQILKRSKTMEEIRLPSNDNYLSYSKVHQGNEEVTGTGTALLLKFSPNYPLPSSEDLNSVFGKYGKLNEYETRVSGQDLTGQVVYMSPSTARDAILRLEKDGPFGSALLSYRVHHLYSVQSAVQAKSPVNDSLDMKPPQDLGVLKKNLEMMNLMLEKSGDSLSPEMRGKLEREIKGLMNKVSAMDGSSSTSCL